MLYLAELSDEEDEHEPEERGCSSCAHQDDYFNVWLGVAWKEKSS